VSEELQRLARLLEEDAARLKAGSVDDGEAARIADSIARHAAEAAALVDRALRAQGPEPRTPGQGALPVGD